MEVSSQLAVMAALPRLKILSVGGSRSRSGRFGRNEKIFNPRAVHVKIVVDEMTLE
jgi:hypothetical protein